MSFTKEQRLLFVLIKSILSFSLYARYYMALFATKKTKQNKKHLQTPFKFWIKKMLAQQQIHIHTATICKCRLNLADVKRKIFVGKIILLLLDFCCFSCPCREYIECVVLFCFRVKTHNFCVLQGNGNCKKHQSL